MVFIARTDTTERFSSHALGIFFRTKKADDFRQTEHLFLTFRLQTGKNTMSHIIGENNQTDAEEFLDQPSK